MNEGDLGPARDERLHIAKRLLATVAVLALVGTVLGLLLVQRLGVTYRDGLALTSDGAAVAAASAESAAALAADVASLAEAATVTLEQTQAILASASDSADGVGVAMGTNLADGVSATANIANGMAGFIAAIERLIPGNSQSLAEDLRTLADGLENVPQQLRDLGDQLVATSEELTTTAESLAPIGDTLDELATSIGDAQATLAEVQALALDVEQRADDALDRSNTDLWLMRLMVLVLGLGVFAACLAAYRALSALERRPAD